MHREQFREYKDVFFAEMTISHVTNDTNQTAIASSIDLYQIQVDTTQSDTATSLEFSTPGGSVFKRVTLAGVGTREITFLGRPYRLANGLYITRPDGDTHIVHLSILYRPV